MSEPRNALGGATFDGLVRIDEAAPRGMIALRADLAAAPVQAAVQKITGLALPERRRIVGKGDLALAWMSPDELLILTPCAAAETHRQALESALKGQHHLAADVSDARALFTLTGPRAREVLAKLTPADLSPTAFPPGELRRSRLAQVAAAFWQDAAGDISLICFRSQARYVFALLKNAARPGSEVDGPQAFLLPEIPPPEA